MGCSEVELTRWAPGRAAVLTMGVGFVSLFRWAATTVESLSSTVSIKAANNTALDLSQVSAFSSGFLPHFLISLRVARPAAVSYFAAFIWLQKCSGTAWETDVGWGAG